MGLLIILAIVGLIVWFGATPAQRQAWADKSEAEAQAKRARRANWSFGASPEQTRNFGAYLVVTHHPHF